MIPNWLWQRSNLSPSRVALSYGDEYWTFRQLHEKAVELASKLRSNGLEEGNRVALLGPSTPEMVFVIHACLYAGVEIVMLNSRLSESEIAWQIRDAHVETVIAEGSLTGLLSACPAIVLTFSDLAASAPAPVEIDREWQEDRTITIMYTSGTTGFPKGVRQTAGNHTSNAISSVLNLGLDEEDAWLCAMPLFHISGFSILVRSVIYGMEVRLYEKFDEVMAARDIREGRVTRMSVVAHTLDRIMRQLEEDEMPIPPRFRTMLAGGGPIPAPMLERAVRLNIPVLQTYGMTETSSQTATLSAEDALRKIGSAGKALFFNQISIQDAKEPGQIGEVLIKGPHVTPGYIGRAAEIAPTNDGWLPTGDLGYLDEEGYLYIVDRRSDLIISGGENIYPAEIESALCGHPAVLEAGVCGQADDKWGSVPVAFVVRGDAVTEQELQEFCSQHLGRYKVPKRFVFVDELPRNAANKLVRRELQNWL